MSWTDFGRTGLLNRGLLGSNAPAFAQLFDELFEPSRLGQARLAGYSLLVNEDEAQLQLRLPGVDPESIDVQVARDRLTVQAERKAAERLEGDIVHKNERVSGKIQRSFHLPFEVQGDKALASFKDGLLTLRLPKSEAEKARRIPIQRG